ncbi:MAG: ABC transporter substrate-binding protein [Chloroflexota bacterium]
MEEAGFPLLSAPAEPLFEIIEKTDDTITVRHQYGESTIPRNPERIITEYWTSELLISIGIMPIGHISWEDEGISPIVTAEAPDMIYLPAAEGANYEQVATLEPDLIIGANWIGGYGDENEYKLMSAIAPTLPFNGCPCNYRREATLLLGELFDRQEEATQFLADYDQQVSDLRAQVSQVFGDETVSPLIFWGPDPWLYAPRYPEDGRVYIEDTAGWLYHEMGLAPGPEIMGLLVPDEGEFLWGVDLISGELLPEIQADHLVVFPNGYSNAEGISGEYTEFTENQLWQTLPAVQADNVHLIIGVNKARGYYTLLDNMRIFADTISGESQ